MNCKYCGAELEQTSGICPQCGIDNAESPAPKKKKNTLKIVFSVTACVLLFAILSSMVYVGAGGKFRDIVNFVGLGKNDIYRKNSYTVEDVSKTVDVVVATVGDKHKLTNSQLQVFYAMEVFDFIEMTNNYPSAYGLDIYTPLDQQVFDEKTGMTWQQWFLDAALNTWVQYVALNELAEDENFTLSDEAKLLLENNYQVIIDSAEDGGYSSVTELIEDDLGAGADMDDYKHYMNLYYLGNMFFDEKAAAITMTEDEIEAYYEANQAMLEESYQITKETGRIADVRHILLQPEGGATDDDGYPIYAESDWEDCRVKAQELLDNWVKGGATQESFAELATNQSMDSGSSENGGLYSNIMDGSGFVEEFEGWAIDESRKPGDYGLIKSVYGYHLMYFVDGEEAWYRYSKQCLQNEKGLELLEEIQSEYTAEITYKNIALGDLVLVAS